MTADWWKCGECRSINGPGVDHCPCLDEPEETDARSKGEREDDERWEEADRALAEMGNR